MVQQMGTARAVQILSKKDEHSFELDEKALRRILLAENVKDKPIVVVTIAGAFRKGKSFLMDFFLRYMRSGCQADWLRDANVPLEGFSWRGGCELDTTGIVLWDEIFLVSTSQGQELAVLFMDTQGAFDCESTAKDCASIFALSILTSSVQVYNLSQNIQEDDLQHLQYCTAYGMLAQQDNGETPFQKLLFLVRDWSYLCDAPYGAGGGRCILNRRLQISHSQHRELKQLRRHIKSCFKEIDCFLMPHPGSKATTSQSFDGRLSDIDDVFTTHLRKLVPSLLQPDNLLVKEINGQRISCEEWMTYFQVYVNTFNRNKLPEPMSLLEATAEVHNLAAVAAAREAYTSGMEQLCGGNQPYLNQRELLEHHVQLRESARNLFSATHKVGRETFSEPYLEGLTKEIDQMFENIEKCNEKKKGAAVLGTPATLLKLWLVFYIASNAFTLVGICTFAHICNLLMSLSLLSLAIWVYSRYIGDMPDVGARIDATADVVWACLLKLLVLCKSEMNARARRSPNTRAN